MEVREYVTWNGRSPFSEWLVSLKDSKVRNGSLHDFCVWQTACVEIGSPSDPDRSNCAFTPEPVTASIAVKTETGWSLC